MKEILFGAKWKKACLLGGLLLISVGFYARKTLSLYIHFAPYSLAGPAPTYETGQGPGFRYSIYHAPGALKDSSDSVVYFLHYGSGDEKSWYYIPTSRVFYAAFRDRGLDPPLVVSVSYGAYWSLFDAGGGRLPSPVASDFLNIALPWLDNKIGFRKRRYLWGMSQGGLNSALLMFKRPELWSGVVLSCPALWENDLYASKESLIQYSKEKGLSFDRFQYGMDLVLNRIANKKEWRREDPLEQASVRRLERLPPLCIDCNHSDEFGFNGGARRFAQVLQSRGKEILFQEWPGDHCAVDPRFATQFLLNLESRGL